MFTLQRKWSLGEALRQLGDMSSMGLGDKLKQLIIVDITLEVGFSVSYPSAAAPIACFTPYVMYSLPLI
jgi:hypothetical protein